MFTDNSLEVMFTIQNYASSNNPQQKRSNNFFGYCTLNLTCVRHFDINRLYTISFTLAVCVNKLVSVYIDLSFNGQVFLCHLRRINKMHCQATNSDVSGRQTKAPHICILRSKRNYTCISSQWNSITPQPIKKKYNTLI